MRLLFATAALCALGGNAAAETYQATGVDVENAAAIVTVIPEDRANVDVSITPGSARLPAPTVRQTADGLVIDGGLHNRFRGCSTTLGGGTQVRIDGIGQVRREDLTRITIRTPRTLDVSFGGAVYATIGASNGGSVSANGCGDTEMAAAAGALTLELNGSGDVRAESVHGALDGALNGSGSLTVARADAGATARLNGSGDLHLGAVAGALDARLNGSGDVDIASAGDGARLALVGSGDVQVGPVRGSLDARLNGSGSVLVASVEGESVDLTLSSSGDLAVRGGHVQRFMARNTGSGDVRFGGSAQSTRAVVGGSGDISIAEAGHVEQLADNGSGDIRIGR